MDGTKLFFGWQNVSAHASQIIFNFGKQILSFFMFGRCDWNGVRACINPPKSLFFSMLSLYPDSRINIRLPSVTWCDSDISPGRDMAMDITLWLTNKQITWQHPETKRMWILTNQQLSRRWKCGNFPARRRSQDRILHTSELFFKYPTCSGELGLRLILFVLLPRLSFVTSISFHTAPAPLWGLIT